MEQTRERYFLSLDQRLEQGWIYRADVKAGGRFDLINELGPSPLPNVEGAREGDYKLVELPKETYNRILELRAGGTDAEIEEAERLIAPYLGMEAKTSGMYLVKRVEGSDAVLTDGTLVQPFGPGWTTAECEGGDSMEVWGTRFSADRADYVEYRLLRDGATVLVRRVEGY